MLKFISVWLNCLRCRHCTVNVQNARHVHLSLQCTCVKLLFVRVFVIYALPKLAKEHSKTSSSAIAERPRCSAVSYTHLTLPTIYSV